MPRFAFVVALFPVVLRVNLNSKFAASRRFKIPACLLDSTRRIRVDNGATMAETGRFSRFRRVFLALPACLVRRNETERTDGFKYNRPSTATPWTCLMCLKL